MVDLVWYFTDQPFQKFPSAINSLDWDESPWTPRVLGEVYRASRKYNGRLTIPGLLPGHQCGAPELFLSGSPWPAIGPLRVYDADGIPECCPRERVPFLTSSGRPAATSTTNGAIRPNAMSSGRPAHYFPYSTVSDTSMEFVSLRSDPDARWTPVDVPEISRVKRRAVVTLASGETGIKMHAQSGASQRAYARRIRADFHVIQGRTQRPDMPTYEKFRVRDYALAYPDGIIYLDADCFVMPDCPDLLKLTPRDKIGMVEIGSRMPGATEFGAEQLVKFATVLGRPIPSGANTNYWNSGVWVGRPEHADYWTPPPFAVPETHHCDEENWCRWNLYETGLPIHSLDKRANWTWCEDRFLAQWDDERPWIVHLAGMGAGMPPEWQLSNSELRVIMLRLLESMRK